MSGKKFADSVKAFDRDQLFTPTEAVTLAKSLAKATFDEGVDIAIRIGHLPDSSLVTTRLGGDVRRVVVGSPGYLAKHPPIKNPADLANHHIIAFSNFGLDAWSFVPAKGSSAPYCTNRPPAKPLPDRRWRNFDAFDLALNRLDS